MVKNFSNFKNSKKIDRKSKNKNFKPKITNESLLEKFNYTFTRDAEWFKKTCETINKTKDDLDKKFYSEEKKKQKNEFNIQNFNSYRIMFIIKCYKCWCNTIT